MKIIALEKEKPGIKPDEFQLYLEDEASKVWHLYKEGVIREIWFRADQNTAVLVLESDSLNDAEKILNDLPLVKNKLIEFEIIPLKPYTGFERLFK